MHELGLVNYVVKQVSRIAEENHVAKIHSVTLEFGEVSGIVTAYRISEGSARRVVCLVPKENVSIVSPQPKATPAGQKAEAADPAATPAKSGEASTRQPAPVAPPGVAQAEPPAGPPRFQMPDLPTPVLPGDAAK